MRHAQYLDELADCVRPYRGPLPLFTRRRDGQASVPSILVLWAGTTLMRDVGWRHAYRIEILAAESDAALDKIVAELVEAVADWKPTTSAARADAPNATPTVTTIGDVAYPTVVITTAANEPR